MPECIKCKKKIPRGSKFCNHCGTKQKAGRLYQRPDGLFEKVITIDGKRVAFRAKTEAAVFDKILNYQAEQKNLEQGLQFCEVAEMWHDDHWESLSPTTQRGYKFAFEEIKECFGDTRIKLITHKDINKYIKQLSSSYAKKTCQTRLLLLNMIFKFAIIEDMIEENPCLYVSVKGHSSKKRRAPTSDEERKIKFAIDVKYKDFPIGLLAVFFLYTGCRKGEALALTFGDIDMEARRLKINKSVYYVSNNPQIKKPKTEAGIREIIIPEILLPLLPKGKKKEYIFSSDKDKPMKQHFFDKAWKHWQEESGLNLTAHQLRHGYATLLHEADVDIKDAQDQLGHADASTTQNIYTEVSQRRRNIVEKRINKYLQ